MFQQPVFVSTATSFAQQATLSSLIAEPEFSVIHINANAWNLHICKATKYLTIFKNHIYGLH